MPIRKVHALLIVASVAGCRSYDVSAPEGGAQEADHGASDSGGFESPFAEGEIFLSFANGSSESGESRSACFFTGPHESVALVELTAKPVVVPIDRDCENPPDYRRSHYRLDARVLRTAHGPAPATFTSIYYAEDQVNEDDLIKQKDSGDTELWSIRKSGDEWFVVSRWGASPSRDARDAELSPGIDLPSRWSELVVAIQDAVTSRNECVTPSWGVTDTNSLGTHEFSDADFHTWAHTLDPRFCQNVNNAPTPNTQPGTTNTNGGG